MASMGMITGSLIKSHFSVEKSYFFCFYNQLWSLCKCKLIGPNTGRQHMHHGVKMSSALPYICTNLDLI